MWFVYVMIMGVCALTGFVLGVTYGQEHPHE